MQELYANNAFTTLAGTAQPWAAAPAPGTVEVWQVASSAAPLPQAVNGVSQWRGVISPVVADTDPEIVIVGVATDATHLTVTRGAEGSTVKAHAAGHQLTCVLTKGNLPSGSIAPPVVLIGTDLSGPVLTLEQFADPAFVGAQALVIDEADVSANSVEVHDSNGNTVLSFRGTDLVISDGLGTWNIIIGSAGIRTEGVTLYRGGGILARPLDPGSDGLFIEGSNLDPAQGGALMNTSNPPAEMAPSFNGPNQLAMNFLLSPGAGAVAWMGKDTDGTDIGAFVPLFPGRHLGTRVTTVPSDGDLVAGDLAFWFDDTNGAAKLRVKAKQADGTVVTGIVALT